MKLLRNFLCNFLFDFNKTALHIAIEKEKMEIIKLLLSKKEIDVNADYISIEFILLYFNL